MILGIISFLTTMEIPSSNIDSANAVAQPYPISGYDCSELSNGCYGHPYCDINDNGSCYDRHEGNDDGSSTDPQSTSYKGVNDPNPPTYD